MKRILIALVILAAGTGAFCAFQSAATQLQREALTSRAAWVAQTQLVSQAQSERTELEGRVRELKLNLSTAQQIMAARTSQPVFRPERGSLPLSPDQCEKLLAELGFNWNTSGDYVVVSKATLQWINLDGMKGAKLTAVADSVLAVTPKERTAIESEAQRLQAEYKSWVQAHALREEPTGDVVAKYSIPADTAFSGNCSNAFASGMLATLGDERGGLLLDYASSWMTDMGMYGGEATTMTVKRYGAGDELRLNAEFHSARSTWSTDASPSQFPEPFRPLFPNGWPDVAKREGFELPKGFEEPPGSP